MTLVIIPARMNSTRLPGKPMLEIGGMTIISRCAAQARKAGFEPYVATDSEAIAEMFYDRGIMTGECASGTDRVAAAAEIIDPEGKHEFVINYQGDMPFLDPQYLQSFVEFREQTKCDILTGITKFDYVYADLPNEFIRGSQPCHIGIYGYTRAALRRFAAMPQSSTELWSKLEQHRAPESFSWKFFDCASMPIEINTQADLDRARSCLM